MCHGRQRVKGTAVNLKSKVARFEQPVIAVKTVTQPANLRRTKKDYTLVHVSFQSTGGTNISTVNTLVIGDDKMRTTTSKNKKKRLSGDEPSLVQCKDNTDRVSYAQYLDVKQPRGKKSRLCTGDLDLLKEHVNSMKRVGKAACQWCGEMTFMRCELCKKHVCLKSDTSATTLSCCCIDFHDDLKYGLGFMDRKELYQTRNKNFKKPTMTEMKKNKTHMKSLMLKYYTDVEE